MMTKSSLILLVEKHFWLFKEGLGLDQDQDVDDDVIKSIHNRVGITHRREDRERKNNCHAYFSLSHSLW